MDPVFSDAPERQRFELHVGEELVGFIDYLLDGDTITLVHTEVDPAHGGQGHGAVLARGALDAARERGLSVRPTCPFVAAYIGKHPEYADLVRA